MKNGGPRSSLAMRRNSMGRDGAVREHQEQGAEHRARVPENPRRRQEQPGRTVVAPRSSFDLAIKSGKQIPIEERKSEEVTHFAGMAIAPRGVKVYNPAFDVTPAKLITRDCDRIRDYLSALW